ncbi:hypothetical protein B0T20DRAFT_218517 [Sordaria brevicollis]|uniref:WD-like domain-containing protein n=1 Tax=Sordaria brevicollis TaxID=83679 RepID=A0AAE0UC92_SORBR|nr:hypothetical protein B0T20DRAFT_218517 [Sordaria brevicollis]
MFAKQIIIAGAFLAALSTAAPASNSVAEIDVPEGLKIIDVTEAAGVELVWYGDADGVESTSEAETPSLSRRCGSNRTQCFNDNQAAASSCEALINGLLNSSNNLPVSPRSVCATLAGNRCCTSWANNLSGAKYYYLQSAASAILRNCRGSAGFVSGKSYDTLLGSTCTTQCLSNRPDGCNNN